MSYAYNMAMALDAISEFTEEYEYVIENVKRICCETIHDLKKAEDEREKNGESRFSGLEVQREGARVADMILEIFGLEVDHYLCDWPILRDKGGSK